MNPKEIERFFKDVDKGFQGKATIFLTGAAAGSLMGEIRPSLDIDFAVELGKKDARAWDDLAAAVERSKVLSGVSADYSEDIDRWGSITLLDYKKHARLFKKIGSLTLKVLEPAYWSIGKMTRYLQPDIDDMIAVFKAQKEDPARLARVWGEALRKSPRSEKQFRFRSQVEQFFTQYGTRVWGKGFEARKAIEQFHKNAGIRAGKKI
jgi:hypothetical protein